MKNYESYEDKWKELLGAIAGLVTNLAGMVWYIAAALVAMMILHSVLSEPFEFTCKGGQIAAQPSKRRAKLIQEMPQAGTSEAAAVRMIDPAKQSQ